MSMITKMGSWRMDEKRGHQQGMTAFLSSKIKKKKKKKEREMHSS